MAAKTQNSDTATNQNQNDSEETEDVLTPESRTDPIDVTESNQALSLLAAWQGVYNFFKGRVTSWNQNEDGSISALGFTVDKAYDPQRILSDISGRDRRIDFPTALRYFNGEAPEAFENPNEMTNFMVNFTKGSAETGTAKTPAYVREAVTRYKSEIGLRSRRGRRRTILRLDDINELDTDALVGTSPEAIDKLIALAQAARAKQTVTTSA